MRWQCWQRVWQVQSRSPSPAESWPVQCLRIRRSGKRYLLLGRYYSGLKTTRLKCEKRLLSGQTSRHMEVTLRTVEEAEEERESFIPWASARWMEARRRITGYTQLHIFTTWEGNFFLQHTITDNRNSPFLLFILRSFLWPWHHPHL